MAQSLKNLSEVSRAASIICDSVKAARNSVRKVTYFSDQNFFPLLALYIDKGKYLLICEHKRACPVQDGGVVVW